MCECGHHWSVHAESNETAQTAICHGYAGSDTPGPLRDPCRCTGFAQWAGPRDSRTGEPVRAITLTTALQAASVPPVTDDQPASAVTAAAEVSARVAEQEAVREDLALLLRTLGMFDGARPESPHEVMLEAIAEVRLRQRSADTIRAAERTTIKNQRHALKEAAAEMDRRYEMGRAAERDRLRQKAGRLADERHDDWLRSVLDLLREPSADLTGGDTP